MSAETLRRAASLMRERALGAQEQGAGRWTTSPTIDPDNDGWVVHLDLEDADWDTTIARTPYDYEGNEVTPHIASWHPAVALAVADWLDHEARLLEEMDKRPGGTNAMPAARRQRSLAVARAYLGESA